MTIYIIAIFVASIFVYKYDICRQLKGRDRNYIILWLILVLIFGLRYKIGGDTIRYMDLFEEIKTLPNIRYSDLTFGRIMPLSYFFISLCKTICNEFVFFQIVHAITINTIIFKFFKKYTIYSFSAVLVYMIWSSLEFNTEILRESLAICVILSGLEHLKNKNVLKYYCFVLVAIFFHVSALVAVLFPLLNLLRLNRFSVFVSLILMLSMTTIYTLLPNYFDLFTFMGGETLEQINNYYDVDATLGNSNRLVFYALKYIVLPISAIAITFRKDNNFCFIGLVMSAIVISWLTNYSYAFTRFLNYFMPFIWIIIGNSIAILPTTKLKKIISSKYLIELSHILFITFSIYIIYIYFNGVLEDMLKYIPYSSIFNPLEIYRPEW